jgi:3-isopropylmalate/(R)-2-methylmalate dehydratase large subunit
MAMTMIEKGLARASGRDQVRVGDLVMCDVDLAVLLDIQFTAVRLAEPKRIVRPDKVMVVMDHAVPAPTAMDAGGQRKAREFAERHGLRLVDIGRHGIVHQLIAEMGLVLPGDVLACTDSHTCSGGAFNAVARGLGSAEMVQIMCTGQTWYQVPPTLRYILTGSLPPLVTGKDIFLDIANRYGSASNHALEFVGTGLRNLALSTRRTIATQVAEIGADFAMFPADSVCQDYLRAIDPSADLRPVDADPDAVYEAEREVGLDQVNPMVALPGTVSHNGVPAGQLDSVVPDQFFIGSCANGQLDDLKIASEILRDRTVARGGRLIVTPASQAVYLDAVRLGYVETIVAAGGVVTNSTCGACFGYQLGVLGAGEVCLTASTRNFQGRMGSRDADIYMASPATVAASAVAGRIVDPRSVL